MHTHTHTQAWRKKNSCLIVKNFRQNQIDKEKQLLADDRIAMCSVHFQVDPNVREHSDSIHKMLCQAKKKDTPKKMMKKDNATRVYFTRDYEKYTQ